MRNSLFQSRHGAGSYINTRRMIESPSPFAKPFDGIRIKEHVPFVPRPTAEEVASFPGQAAELLESISRIQQSCIASGAYHFDALKGKHFLLAGATGPGVGGAVESAARLLTKSAGSVTVVARDISKSVGFEMGKQMSERAAAAEMGARHHVLNDGVALEGPAFEKIVAALKEAGANDVIYINGVAAAMSGMQPGMPPVYVKDVDADGLFQWKLMPLAEQAIQNTRHVMGTLAVEFPRALERAGFRIACSCFMDWRGSLDLESRRPDSPWYGRQGAYSTSLYLPKDVLQKETRDAYGTGRIVLDVFLPIMRTRALPFIPGGMTLSYLYDELMKRAEVRRLEVPELALGLLHAVSGAITSRSFHPFARCDSHEAPLDEWFTEIVLRMNEDSASEFYWKKWMSGK